MMPRMRCDAQARVFRLGRSVPLVALVVAALGWVAACGAPVVPRETPAGYPPDFALVMTVYGEPSADAGRDPEPRHRSAQHIVTPDRLLRAALGPGTHADYYPGPTAKLSPAQMGLIYRLAVAALASENTNLPHENTPPTPPNAATARAAAVPALAPGAGVSYRLTLEAHARVTTYDTTPQRNAAATALLDELIRLRGGR